MYEWLWKHIGGRKWTYILRDLWHKFEFLWIFILVGIGAILGRSCEIKTLGIILASVTAGYILGHLFWGTKYKENQGG